VTTAAATPASTPAPMPIPTSTEYHKALRLLYVANTISDAQWSMLRAHCLAPEYTLTTVELAEAAGFEKPGAVNLNYGRFGAKLAGRLLYTVPPKEPQASVFATFAEGGAEAPQTRWTLRPEIVAAVKLLNWFPRLAKHKTA
jgi:lipopolysaccharide biosynthesis protein